MCAPFFNKKKSELYQPTDLAVAQPISSWKIVSEAARQVDIETTRIWVTFRFIILEAAMTGQQAYSSAAEAMAMEKQEIRQEQPFVSGRTMTST